MTVEHVYSEPEALPEGQAGALFAEQRFHLASEIAASCESVPDGYLGRIAGELTLRLAVPVPDLNTDRERLAGLMCLAGHVYDVLHPELFEDEPPATFGMGERQLVMDAYDGAVWRATTFVYGLNFYLDSDMTRFRRVRDRIGFPDDDELSALAVTVRHTGLPYDVELASLADAGSISEMPSRDGPVELEAA
jgi:hypothetical protein